MLGANRPRLLFHKRARCERERVGVEDRGRVGYRCEALTASGFVQQLACGYLMHGYHHYVVGEVPERKDPRAIDARIIERYGLEMSRAARARRKLAGLANAQYIRFRHFFVICATDPVGGHPFFEAHPPRVVGGKAVPQIRNIKTEPIAFGGYSIGYHRGIDRKWHVSVRVHPERYRDLKAMLVDLATKRSVENLVEVFRKIPFEPYAPVRRQLLNLLRAVNRERAVKGWEAVTQAKLDEAWRVGEGRRERWLSRRVVRPFGFEDDVASPAATRENAA